MSTHTEIYLGAAIAAVVATLITRSFWRGYVQTDWGRYYATTHTRRFRRTIAIWVGSYVVIMLGIVGTVMWVALRGGAPTEAEAKRAALDSFSQICAEHKFKPADFLLISGDDMLTVALYALGAKGVISVLANALPVVFRKMKEYAFGNQFSKASQELFKLTELNGPMYEEGNPVGVKYLLAEMGIGNGNVRLPMVGASAHLQSRIKIAYSDLKEKKR